MSRGDAWSVAVTFLITGVGYFVGGPLAASVCLVVGIAMALILHFTRPGKKEATSDTPSVAKLEPEKVQSNSDTCVSATDWRNLASDFDAINDPSIQAEWNRPPDLTETWLVCCGDYKRCEALCSLAGARLLRSPRILASLPEKIRFQPDHLYRWLDFLKERGCVGDILTGEVTDVDGKTVGFHLHGLIHDLPAVSGHTCTECAAAET